jgi:hypothetical protein
VRFAFAHQIGADSPPPVRFRNIQRDNVRERRILLRKDEGNDSPCVFRKKTFGTGLRKKITQHRFRIRDARRKTRLVQFVQRGKITRFILSNRYRHAADCRNYGAVLSNYFTVAERDIWYAQGVVAVSSNSIPFRRRLCEP